MAHGIGVKLPIRLGNTGYFEQTFTTLDQARANLLNLLLTNKGERPMQPTFGTDLTKLLFEQNVDNLTDEVERIIQQAVNFWLPYILIQKIDINTDPKVVDENKIEILLTFSVEQSPNRNDTIILQFNF